MGGCKKVIQCVLGLDEEMMMMQSDEFTVAIPKPHATFEMGCYGELPCCLKGAVT